MSAEPAFRRAFWATILLFAPVLFWAGSADAGVVKEPPCRNLSTSGPYFAGGVVSYTAGAYCPQADVVRWTLQINRGGVRWAVRSGLLNVTPAVARRCVRKGPPVTLRPILTVDSWYGAGTQHTRTYRGPVTSARCA